MKIIKIKLKGGFHKPMKMNKKGDLPVTLLVIGVFAVCTLALLSFLYSSYQAHKSLVGVDIIEEANMQIELQSLNHLYLDARVNKFSPEWGFNWFKEEIVFSVEYNP